MTDPATLTDLANIAFAVLLAVIAIVDAIRRVVPDVLSMGGLAMAFALAGAIPEIHATASSGHALLQAALGALAGAAAGLLLRVAGNALLGDAIRRSGETASLGLGDVKLLAFLGAYLGWRSIPPILLIACVSGALFGSVRKLATGSPGQRWKSGDSVLPFAPFLCLGAAARLFLDVL